MSGAIRRLPGEKFADFAARQKEAQNAERVASAQAAKYERWARRAAKRDNAARRAYDNLDWDYSMNY